MSEQLGIIGIGQKKYTLAMWKEENKIFTHHAPHMPEPCWSCWDQIEDPGDFISNHGDHNMGFGETERQSIMDFCRKQEIKPPFWW